MDGPADQRAWSWVAHLRAGGTTPWTRWSALDGAPDRAQTVLPGAQQLELLRRVNAAAAGDVGTDVADRVVTASAHDRGRADLPLVGGPGTAFGPAPVDPAQLPVDELLRVAALLLADALPGVPASVAPGPRDATAGRRHRALRGGYRLVGDPWVSGRVREELRRLGRPPGGPRPRALVVTAGLDRLLADTWTHRVWTTGAPSWRQWLAGFAGGRLPHGADVAGQAEAWSERVGRRRVVVVTDLAELGRLTGVRRLELPPTLGLGLGGPAVDLARRVRLALAVVAPPAEHTALLLDRLRPALVGVGDGPGPTVPVEHADWLARRAARQRRRLARAGYAVAGDTDLLLPGGGGAAPGGPAHDEPDPEQVLDLAVTLLARGLVPGTGSTRDAGSDTDHGG